MKGKTMNKYDLERRLVYAIIVAGKNARFATEKTKALFKDAPVCKDGYPKVFDYIKSKVKQGDKHLIAWLESSKVGCYKRMVLAFKSIAKKDIDLKTCTKEELEEIPYVGLKTSRFFLLWTRDDAQCAALDVHILRFLREELGVDAPSITPQRKKEYESLEKIFLDECRERGLTPKELDKQVWERYSKSIYDGMSNS